jgi:hypothetical protein
LLAFALLLSLTLAACGGNGDGGGAGEEAASRVTGEVTGDLIHVDREQMTELPCHAMDNTIMGNCSEEDVDSLLQEMGLTDDTAILVDRQLMNDQACHNMGNAIMGNCSDADVERLASEIRASR